MTRFYYRGHAPHTLRIREEKSSGYAITQCLDPGTKSKNKNMEIITSTCSSDSEIKTYWRGWRGGGVGLTPFFPRESERKTLRNGIRFKICFGTSFAWKLIAAVETSRNNNGWIRSSFPRLFINLRYWPCKV